MWNNLVSNSDIAARQLQASFAEAVVAHPILMVGAIAGGLALITTVWIVTLEYHVRQMQEQMWAAERDRPIRLRRF